MTLTTGLAAKYDELLAEFNEARGHFEYRILGDRLRRWAKKGESDDVKTFCRILIEAYPNRPALIYEMESFFTEQENNNRHAVAEAAKRIKEFNKPVPTCPKCKSQNIAKISYGFPYMDSKLEKDIADGKVVLGGCEYEPWYPNLHCNDCGLEFSTRRGGMMNMNCLVCDEMYVGDEDSYDICEVCGRENEQYGIEDDEWGGANYFTVNDYRTIWKLTGSKSWDDGDMKKVELLAKYIHDRYEKENIEPSSAYKKVVEDCTKLLKQKDFNIDSELKQRNIENTTIGSHNNKYLL